MDCRFEQTEKNIVYKIEEYQALEDRWELDPSSFKTFELAKEYYDNNSRLEFTEKDIEQGKNFYVFRIIEVKTINKPVLTNTKQFKIQKNHIIKLRKQGRI
tara:strand:- start:276 stop:578 length:303 start_codon:yes stop_codon:yes gene_type:complete